MNWRNRRNDISVFWRTLRGTPNEMIPLPEFFAYNTVMEVNCFSEIIDLEHA